MLFRNAEIYNVHELLEGDGLSVLTEGTRNQLKAEGGDPDAVWGAEDGEGLWFCRIPNELRLRLNTSARLVEPRRPGPQTVDPADGFAIY